MADIRRVTFTGIDDETDIDRLNRLSERYGFVEWGILLSQSKSGVERRFPSFHHLNEMMQIRGKLSVHVCGAWAQRAALYNSRDIFGLVRSFLPSTGRCQLNISKSIKTLNLPQIVNAKAQSDIATIIQVQEFADFLEVAKAGLFPLLDRSGGTGHYLPFPAPPEALHSPYLPIGYAGGIGPDNIKDVLAEIASIRIPNPVWIDMESKVRTDDYLDLDKVEAVLKAVEAAIPNI